MPTKLRWSLKLVMNTCTLSICTCLSASLSRCSRLFVYLLSLASWWCTGHKSGLFLTEWEDPFLETIWLTQPWVSWFSSDPLFTVWEAWLGSTSFLKVHPNMQSFQTSLPSLFQLSCGFFLFPLSSHAASMISKTKKLSMIKPEFSSPLNTIDSIPLQLPKEPRIIKNTLKITWKTWRVSRRMSNKKWLKCLWDSNKEESGQTCPHSLFLRLPEWWTFLHPHPNLTWWLRKWCPCVRWCQWWPRNQWWWIPWCQWWIQWWQGLFNLCSHSIHLVQTWWLQDSVPNLHRLFRQCNNSNLSQNQWSSKLLHHSFLPILMSTDSVSHKINTLRSALTITNHHQASTNHRQASTNHHQDSTNHHQDSANHPKDLANLKTLINPILQEGLTTRDLGSDNLLIHLTCDIKREYF